jgi:hypothetical protein
MGERLVMSAFIVGFAGLSVHAQVVAVLAKYGFSLVPYFVGKLLHGLIAALYTYIYLKFFPITEAVFAPSIGMAFFASATYAMLPLAFGVVITVAGMEISKFTGRGVKE